MAVMLLQSIDVVWAWESPACETTLPINTIQKSSADNTCDNWVCLQELMGRYEAVNREGWQAFGAIQALLSREAALKDLTLNELQSLFRQAASPLASLIFGSAEKEWRRWPPRLRCSGYDSGSVSMSNGFALVPCDVGTHVQAGTHGIAEENGSPQGGGVGLPDAWPSCVLRA